MKDKCGQCKFWEKVGRNTKKGFEPKENGRGYIYGICQINPPVTWKPSDNIGVWPEILEDEGCGRFEDKVSERDRLLRKYWRVVDDCVHITKGRNELKKELKEIIKAVKKKYPKIRSNKKAVEKAIEIILT